MISKTLVFLIFILESGLPALIGILLLGGLLLNLLFLLLRWGPWVIA